MCDTKFHDHWCSGCGKNLNKEPEDSYIEIEWQQTESGQFIQDKKMLCKACLEEMPNVKELNEFFSTLQYQPWGHVFCSSCKKDITKEYKEQGTLTKLANPQPGVDYECLEFKEHNHKRHLIKVVVLCKDCVKEKFTAENIENLKKLGRNPAFKPRVTCPNTEKCRQFKKGDENVNCRHIVIGRDRETLNMALLCGRKHKGALPMPYDDGLAIVRPRKKKGAAMMNPVSVPPFQGVAPSIMGSVKDFEKVFLPVMRKISKEFNLNGSKEKIEALEARLAVIEKELRIEPKIEAVKEAALG